MPPSPHASVKAAFAEAAGLLAAAAAPSSASDGGGSGGGAEAALAHVLDIEAAVGRGPSADQ